MAGTWENSAVIALRDSQWKRKNVKTSHPDEYVALAGDPEAATADAIYFADDFLFLFEVKGTRGNVREEWMRQEKGVDQPKQVHVKLMNLVRQFAELGDENSRKNLQMSMRCHYFAYWKSKHVPGEKDMLNELVIAPYVIASLECLSRSRSDAALKRSGFTRESLSAVKQKVDDAFALCLNAGRNTGWAMQEEVGIGLLGTRLLSVLETTAHKPNYLEMGLDAVLFGKYLEFLSEGVTDEKLLAVIMSKKNGFFRRFDRLRDLLSIYERPKKPRPSSSSTPRLANNPRARTVK